MYFFKKENGRERLRSLPLSLPLPLSPSICICICICICIYIYMICISMYNSLVILLTSNTCGITILTLSPYFTYCLCLFSNNNAIDNSNGQFMLRCSHVFSLRIVFVSAVVLVRCLYRSLLVSFGRDRVDRAVLLGDWQLSCDTYIYIYIHTYIHAYMCMQLYVYIHIYMYS